MNRLICLIIISLTAPGCGKYIADFPVRPCGEPKSSPGVYSKAAALEKALDELTRKGAPGVVMAVQSGEGLWTMARGYARIEDRTPMQTCHLQYLQSISKTYLAVSILKLAEQGRLVLDKPITAYLPIKYRQFIPQSDKITVRMLLNHSSGIAEYNFVPAYVSFLLQHPLHDFKTADYLGYIKGKKLVFVPGSRHLYTNTNYLLLSLIADSLAGNHAGLISQTIFKPLGLAHTFYRNDTGYLLYPQLVNSYWDRYGNGILENISQMQRINVSTLTGDDGIVTTPADAVSFLKALAEGRLLGDSTLKEMQTWIKNKKGKPVYGLGLNRREIDGFEAFGHSGGGIGAGAELYYFPEKKLCYFIAVNLGTVTSSPLDLQLEKSLDKIYRILLDLDN